MNTVISSVPRLGNVSAGDSGALAHPEGCATVTVAELFEFAAHVRLWEPSFSSSLAS